MSDNPITLLLPLDGDLTGHVSADSDDDITATGSGAVRYEDGYASGTQAALLEVGSTNLIRNPQFNGSASWGVGPNLTAVSQDAAVTRDGIPAGTVTATSTSGVFESYVYTDSIPATEGTVQQARIAIRSSRAGVLARLRVYDMPGFLDIYDSAWAELATGSDWTEFAAPAGAAAAGTTSRWFLIHIDETTTQVGDQFWLVQPQMEDGATPTTYLDGSLGTGYAWTGIAHNSASTRAAASIAADNSYLDPERGSLAFRYYRERDTGGVETILTCGTDGSGTDHLTLRIAADDTLEMAWTADGAAETVTATTGTIPTENWVYITADWDGTVTHLGVDLTETVTGTRDTPEGSWGAGDLTLEAT